VLAPAHAAETEVVWVLAPPGGSVGIGDRNEADRLRVDLQLALGVRGEQLGVSFSDGGPAVQGSAVQLTRIALLGGQIIA
jgi:hypothetical protein